jgi:hypothetical protein
MGFFDPGSIDDAEFSGPSCHFWLRWWNQLMIYGGRDNIHGHALDTEVF